ncbi:hypothetical protein N9L76_00250 [bacterium]|nr:hypothetical protein [bacterium]
MTTMATKAPMKYIVVSGGKWEDKRISITTLFNSIVQHVPVYTIVLQHPEPDRNL